jgi:hypothetical protein
VFDVLCSTVYGIVSKLVWKVSKPSCFSDNVRYWFVGVIGIWNVSPMMYRGLIVALSVTYPAATSASSLKLTRDRSL